MFSKLFAVASLAVLAVATPMPQSSSCSTGEIQCCSSTEQASDPSAAAILGLLGVVLQDVDVLVGLDCSPITVIGVGDAGSCSASAVCCEDNSFGTLISIGCVPVTL